MDANTKIALQAVKNRMNEGKTLDEALALYPKLSETQIEEIKKEIK